MAMMYSCASMQVIITDFVVHTCGLDKPNTSFTCTLDENLCRINREDKINL